MSKDQQIYNIGQAAKMFKVATSLLRFWESEFDIIQPGKDDKGNRFYTEKDIENIRIIYHLVKERGFTLVGAKQELSRRKLIINEQVDLRKELTDVRNFLVELKSKLPTKK